jgi:hypothetical protein
MQNGLKQGGALSPLIFNVVLEYAILMVHENQVGLKLNATHQLLIRVDDVIYWEITWTPQRKQQKG